MKNKWVIVGIILFALIIIVRIGYLIAPGVDPYAEVYRFDIDESKLIAKIDSFKEKNKQYKVPKAIISDSVNNNYKISGRYYLYFYDRQENKILFAWLRSDFGNKKNCDIHFVGINDGPVLKRWKRINDDLSNDENKKFKRVFETEILDLLNVNYTNEGNAMSPF